MRSTKALLDRFRALALLGEPVMTEVDELRSIARELIARRHAGDRAVKLTEIQIENAIMRLDYRRQMENPTPNEQREIREGGAELAAAIEEARRMKMN